MRPALPAVLAASLLIASGSAGAGRAPDGGAAAAAPAAPKIILRGRRGISGPWRSYLWLKLARFDIVSFSVCGVWDQTLLPPACRAARGQTLPPGTVLRLEQRRKAGWKTVGTSREAALQAVLSNAVAGNRLGAVSYRVTLRDSSRRIRASSNLFRVFWHK
jgi:hypothetical protein